MMPPGDKVGSRLKSTKHTWKQKETQQVAAQSVFAFEKVTSEIEEHVYTTPQGFASSTNAPQNQLHCKRTSIQKATWHKIMPRGINAIVRVCMAN